MNHIHSDFSIWGLRYLEVRNHVCVRSVRVHLYICMCIYIYTYLHVCLAVLLHPQNFRPVYTCSHDATGWSVIHFPRWWSHMRKTWIHSFFFMPPNNDTNFFSRHKACSHPTFFCPGQVWWRSSMVNLLWCWRRSNWGYQWYHESLTMHQSWGYHGNMRDLHTTSRSTVRSEKCLGAEG